MDPSRSSSSASKSTHPLDSVENQEALRECNQTLRKVKKMTPVDVWAIEWNAVDRETEFYKTEEEARRFYYDENHSAISKFTALMDDTGAFYIMTLNLNVGLEQIEVHDRKSQLEQELAETRKRKREIEKELEEFKAC